MATLSARDFWKCHACLYQNNSALCPEKCLKCGHNKCSACTPGSSSASAAFSEYNSFTTSPQKTKAQRNSASSSKDAGYDENGNSHDDFSYHDEHNYKFSSQANDNYDYDTYDNSQPRNEADHQREDSNPASTPRHAPHDYFPDMTGYWVCHNCGQTNTPALNPEQCGNCGHLTNYCCSSA